MAMLAMTEGKNVRKSSLVLVADGDAAPEVSEAVALSGAAVTERLAWSDLDDGLPFPVQPRVVVLEAAGIDEAVLERTLPHVDVFIRDHDAAAIVAVDAARIDLAAAALLGPRTQILCDATLGERIGAIAVAQEAVGVTPVPHDTLAEGEAERLHKLNEEVARIAEVLARLTRRAGTGRSAPAAVAEQRMSFGMEPPSDLTIEPAEVRRAIRARRLRDQFFGNGLFEEPGWDMILDLFAAELERTRVSVSSLCIAAAVAPTTALRWISKLTEAGLFERQPDPFDRRRAYMELSPQAGEAMRAYVAALRRVGLSLG